MLRLTCAAYSGFTVRLAPVFALEVYSNIPFGLPNEPTPKGGGSGAGRAFSVQGYGMMQWQDLFTSRQLLALGIFIVKTRSVPNIMKSTDYSEIWREAVTANLALVVDRIADRGSTVCHWDVGYEKIANTFTGFKLPISWDFSETGVMGDSTGSYTGQLEWVALYIEHALNATNTSSTPHVKRITATDLNEPTLFDAIVTDPPYYDAIPYSDLMDFFYVFLRRTVFGLSSTINSVFSEPLSPKWDHEKNDGELIDDDSRFAGNKERSKAAYEDGMARVFQNCFYVLQPEGRLVIVFAHKHPDAWETLVSAIIRSGFVVDGSWPIQTEMGNRTRALSGAALASSVWMVCRKRSENARPGWDNRVLEEMRANITLRLRQFWDAGIRGPDFVWAATGPALEAYSQYPAVKKANQPGELLAVGEFLTHVRRMVVDFVVGRVLSTLTHAPLTLQGDGGEAENVDVSSLDALTTYYLLHRNDFGLNDAPAGPCILYAVSCGLSDGDLADRYDLLARRGGKAAEEEDAESDAADGESEASEGTGSVFRIKAWNLRKRPNMGYEHGEEQAMPVKLPLFPDMAAVQENSNSFPVVIPLIDQVHRLMHLWRAGDVTRVDDYLERRTLRRNQLFHQLLQALIELAPAASEERSLLESISNHVGAGGKNIQQSF